MIWLFHCRFLRIFLTQAVSSFVLSHFTKGTQKEDSVMTNFSYLSILNLIWPSKVTQAPVLASSGSTMLITALLGKIIGLNESE